MIDFACTGCRKKLRVKDESAGKTVTCPGCGQRVAIPALAASRTPEAGGPSAPAAQALLPSTPAYDATIDSGPRTQSDDLGPPAADFLAPPKAADELGRLGPFRVLKILGQGGMGMVFQAEDVALERMVALKTLLPTLAANPRAKERFLREARSAAKIEHEHIISIYRVDEDRGVPYLAMPLLQGQPLDAFLKGQPQVPVRETARIGREIAEGLAAAHAKGMIHRDIKPGNIWLEGDRRKVKILDFGLARTTSDITHLTQTGAIVGTPAFMAPEQARGAAVDARADLFSLGCILYEMATGRRAFSGGDTMAILSSLALDTPTPPGEVNPAVPAELSAIVMHLLEKQPEDRFASAADVALALRAVEESAAPTTSARSPATVTSRRANPAPSPRSRSRRGRYAVLALGVVTLATLAWLLPGLLVRDPGAPGGPPVEVHKDPLAAPADRAALEFDGEDDGVEIPRLAIDTRKPFTMECFVRVDEIGGDRFATPVLAASNTHLALDKSGRITFWIGSTDKRGSVLSEAPIPLKTWTHVAAMSDGKRQSLFINGRRQAKSLAFTPADGPYGPGFHVASSAAKDRRFSKRLKGAVEGIRVSSAARYGDEFTPTKQPFAVDPQTIAVYDFDRARPGTLVDRSANGFDGTITGARWAHPANANRALLLVWLAGGPSQIDTFDPKPGKTTNIFPAIETSVPGIQFADTLPKLAKQAHHLAIIRTVTHRHGEHNQATTLMKTGRLPGKTVEFPSIACVVGKELARPGTPQWVRFRADDKWNETGFLGAEHGPVVLVTTKEPLLSDLPLQLQTDVASVYAVLLSAHRATAIPDHRKRYPAGLAGHQALMAVKLLEAGVPAVELAVGGWDHHADVKQGMRKPAEQLDQSLATMISDLEASGRLKDTLIVVMGEFGRTVTLNNEGGRGHKSDGFCVALGGGLVRGGLVVGKTSDDGAKITERPVTVEELHATIYAALGIDPGKTHSGPGGTRIPYTEPGAQPIAELLPAAKAAKAE